MKHLRLLLLFYCCCLISVLLPKTGGATGSGKKLEIYESGGGGDKQLGQETPEHLQYKCTFLADLNFYDLSALANSTTFFKFENVTYYRYNLFFSLCKDLPREIRCKDYDKDKEVQTKFMAIANNTDEGCITLAQSGNQRIDHFILDRENNNGLKIHMSGGDYCDDWRDYSITLNIQCDITAKEMQNVVINETHRCFKSVSFRHHTGCKIGQLSALWEWSTKHGWVLAIPSIIVGFLICFRGITVMKVAYMLSGIVITLSCTLLVFYSTFLQTNSKDWVGWLVFAVSIVCGVGIGFLFIKFSKVGTFFLGSLAGFGVGLMIFNSVVYLSSSYVALWCLTLGLGGISGALSLYLPEYLEIHSTGVVGSFLLTNGIGLLAGRYQNPFTLVELMRYGEVVSVDPMFYIYLACYIFFYSIGVVYQYKKLRNFKKGPRKFAQKRIN